MEELETGGFNVAVAEPFDQTGKVWVYGYVTANRVVGVHTWTNDTWSITHLPTGLRMCLAKKRTTAMKIAVELSLVMPAGGEWGEMPEPSEALDKGRAILRSYEYSYLIL